MRRPSMQNYARVEDIVRAVLHVLAEWESAQRPPDKWWERWLKFLSAHWPVLTVTATVLTAGGAALLYDFSIFYPFRALALNQKELVQKEAEFRHQAEEREFKTKTAHDYLDLAKSFLDVGQLKEAEHAYQQSLELDPLNVEAKTGLFKGQVYTLAQSAQYDPEVIKQRLEFILARYPKDPHVLTALGNLYARLDREQAIKAYRKAIENDPHVAEAHFGLATLYLKKDDYEQALKPLEKALELSPWNSTYLENLAYVYDQKNDFEKALRFYQQVLALNPDYLSPHFEIANALRLRGELDQALSTQAHLIALLTDTRVSALPKNQKALYFPTANGPIYLRRLPQKLCYAYYGRSVTLYLLGREQEAKDYADKVQGLKLPDEPYVRELVTHDLRRLKTHQGSLASKIERYADAYLKPGTDANR